MSLINIENENLANYIMFKSDKIDNGFTEEELDKITEVVINYDDEIDNSYVFLEELLKLKKLKSITLRNGYIFDDDYDIFLSLNDLYDFTFENCEFENINLITSLKLKSLSLINCKIDDYSFINVFEDLEELSITNGKIMIDKLNMLKNLKYLQISYSSIIDNSNLNINMLEELYIDNTNISDFNFLNNLSNLKKLSIDEKQYNSNKELFKSLIKRNILVLNENMVTFYGGHDGE